MESQGLGRLCARCLQCTIDCATTPRYCSFLSGQSRLVTLASPNTSRIPLSAMHNRSATRPLGGAVILRLLGVSATGYNISRMCRPFYTSNTLVSRVGVSLMRMDQNPLRRVSYAVTPYVGKAHMDHTKAFGALRLAKWLPPFSFI